MRSPAGIQRTSFAQKVQIHQTSKIDNFAGTLIPLPTLGNQSGPDLALHVEGLHRSSLTPQKAI